MKRVLVPLVFSLTSLHLANAQTKTVTVDANDILNNNTKIVAQTSSGQTFFTGHQIGSGYYFPASGIFRAITDNPAGAGNYYYDGLTNGAINFSVRADGQGYFAGNVGVGTSNPQTALHTVSSGAGLDAGNINFASAGGLLIQANTGGRTTATGAQLEFALPANTDGSNTWGQARIITVAGNANTSDATGKMILGTRRMFNKLGTGGQWYYGNDLVIDGAGNIGIGTLTPKEALSVNGNIRSKQVKVEVVNWPDYVFTPDYQLPSLTDTKAYIDQNHHLPEIPSEVEVAKDGLNLGEMNRLLLKKVEELTLYLIEKDKQDIENTDQLKIMSQEIADLKKQVIHLNKKTT
ncbi:hypothetical protein [Mucilaginibacter flavus]|uniref:hypothetical protein n=1 Tax=Mucilaginibacter flavus TaxID=931504 RepID=UPI0025B38584|nr:hypothetical protein [Mucilaginibacter flavus]MDN3580774.1 hypothetical protein [Mucilaginibacter flavus]